MGEINMNKRTKNRLFSSLVSISLIFSAAGCNQKASVTTEAPAESSTAAETAEETTTTTEETTLKVENQSFEYRPGDVITFGKYEQNNSKSDGKEDIEWYVLATEGNKMLVLSRFALDRHPYNTKKADVTWETCTLRKWLNESFYESAFDEEEKSHIIKTTVPADKNPEYDTPTGNPTTDNVFLLSIDEYNKYVKSDEILGCAGTDYTNAKVKHPDGFAFTWWLRTPGKTSKQALGVVYYRRDKGASVDNNGIFVNNVASDDRFGYGGVRPAMWIELPDKYTDPNKHIESWVEGYATARVTYKTPEGEKTVDVPNVPCQILYIDGIPSSEGKIRELRQTRESSQMIREWIEKNVGEKNLIDGTFGYELLVNSGHREKTA